MTRQYFHVPNPRFISPALRPLAAFAPSRFNSLPTLPTSDAILMVGGFLKSSVTDACVCAMLATGCIAI
jgi:hypothetical protein